MRGGEGLLCYRACPARARLYLAYISPYISPYISAYISPVSRPSARGAAAQDHRFEWTQGEFKEWAAGLAAAHGYRVRFDGIGGGPFGEKQRPNEPWHGPGPSSQVAIFERG